MADARPTQPRAAPFPLMQLPIELIEKILWALRCRHIQWVSRPIYHYRSLADLSQASRALHAIATPILYYHFDSKDCVKRIANFLRSLCTNPELGRHLRELDLSVSDDRWFVLTEAHVGTFSKLADGLGVSLPDAWEDDVCFEIMAQLIVSQSSRLRRLQFCVYQVFAREGVGAFTLLEQLAQKSFSLPFLNEFYYSHGETRDISLEYFAGLLIMAPSLQTIVADPWYDPSGIYAPGPTAQPIPIGNVSKLCFMSGHISRDALEAIVSSCRRLETFVFQHATIYSGLTPLSVTPRQAVEILRHHSVSLREIKLNLQYRDDLIEICPEGDQIPSLAEFSVLESLSVDGSTLVFTEPGVSHEVHARAVLAELLPASIRCFHLTEAGEGAPASIAALADSIHRFPFLEEVLFDWNPEAGGGMPAFNDTELETLRAKFQSQGIRFLKMDRDRWGDAIGATAW
ncbi:hypothetical protein GQ53DRAFT_835831 [Thozetella sp. PMI_491]|nr:hypothetical protein GQ53DRAFT_835831 [Thozetella sp. PMI_491]